MTTITRETLELAALAAGINLTYRHTSGAYYYDDPETGREEWRPHTNIADAARLADKYLMYVDSRGMAVQARLYPGDQWTRVERDGNPHAWCEAVTLCLAAEGRRMRKGGR